MPSHLFGSRSDRARSRIGRSGRCRGRKHATGGRRQDSWPLVGGEKGAFVTQELGELQGKMEQGKESGEGEGGGGGHKVSP